MKNKNLTLLILCIVTLILSGCGDESAKSDTAADTTATETAVTEISVPKSQSKEIPGLLYNTEKAILTGAPAGGNPRYYKFSDGLTCYVADNYSKQTYECTLTLPDGCTDGNIVYISGGAGSGEVFIGVSTVHNGETVYLDYYFYAGGSLTDPVDVFVHDERALPYLDTIGGENQVLS